jgi:RHS repeat-associated protein
VYTYDEANRLTSVDGAPYSWDANGNLLNDGLRTYSYDHANRLSSVVQGPNTHAFAYNGLGDRLQQTENGVTTNYTLDIESGLTQVLSDGGSTFLYGVGRIAQADPGSRAYFLGDALNSARQLVDDAGRVGLGRAYEPYGDPLSIAGEMQTAYGFAGEWRDATGLVNLRARYYAPGDGMFVSRDAWPSDDHVPISQQRWMYAEDNPENRLDPSGYYTQSEIKTILGVRTYDDVLRTFEFGSLAGQWGFLAALHEMGDFGHLEIYELGWCGEPPPAAPSATGASWELRSVWIKGVPHVVETAIGGSLHLVAPYGLLIVGVGNVGWPALWFVPSADYYRGYDKYSKPFESWAFQQRRELRLVMDYVDWPQFREDAPRLLPFIIVLASGGEATPLAAALEKLNLAIDAVRLGRAALPIVLNLMASREPGPTETGDFSREVTSVTLGEFPVEFHDTKVPVYSFIRLMSNLGGALRVIP